MERTGSRCNRTALGPTAPIFLPFGFEAASNTHRRCTLHIAVPITMSEPLPKKPRCLGDEISVVDRATYDKVGGRDGSLVPACPSASESRWLAEGEIYQSGTDTVSDAKARIALLAKEKELKRAQDEVAKMRRQLPWLRVEKDYVFGGPDGAVCCVAQLPDSFEATRFTPMRPVSLLGDVAMSSLFGEAKNLILVHFMFDPEWDGPCSVCTAPGPASADYLFLVLSVGARPRRAPPPPPRLLTNY